MANDQLLFEPYEDKGLTIAKCGHEVMPNETSPAFKAAEALVRWQMATGKFLTAHKRDPGCVPEAAAAEKYRHFLQDRCPDAL